MINIRITPKAFMKMQTLIVGYDKEVGWFGTVERTDDGFRVKDILVFPQYTSGAYIDDEREDPLEFRKWLDTLDDETYRSRRLWGHSHVNMGVSPSGTDKNMFKDFSESNKAAVNNRFAITMIINKKMDMYWWAYDHDANKEYKDKDINIIFEIEDGLSQLQYFEESKTLVRDIYPANHFIFGSHYGYGSYGNNYGHKGYASGYNYGTYNKHEEENKKEKTVTNTINTSTSAQIVKLDDDDYCFDNYYESYYNYCNADRDVASSERDYPSYNRYFIFVWDNDFDVFTEEDVAMGLCDFNENNDEGVFIDEDEYLKQLGEIVYKDIEDNNNNLLTVIVSDSYKKDSPLSPTVIGGILNCATKLENIDYLNLISEEDKWLIYKDGVEELERVLKAEIINTTIDEYDENQKTSFVTVEFKVKNMEK